MTEILKCVKLHTWKTCGNSLRSQEIILEDREIFSYFGFDTPAPTPKPPQDKSKLAHPTKVYNDLSPETMGALLAWWETYFRQRREFPSLATTLAYFPKGAPFLDSAEFRTQLKNRGLPYDQLLTPDGFPVGFINACNLLLDFSDRRSKQAKLKSLGITTREWAMWLKLPKCLMYFQQETESWFTHVTPVDAKQALSRAVEIGDLNAVKYYHELQNIYRPGQETMLNITAVLAQIMEILVKYVEPAKLSLIASELEGVIDTTSRELTPQG